MATNTTIQIRIDSKMKKEAKAFFNTLGTDISGATKMFIAQSLKTKTLAVKGLTENGFTHEQESEILKELEWTKKHAKRYSSVTEMLDSILKK